MDRLYLDYVGYLSSIMFIYIFFAPGKMSNLTMGYPPLDPSSRHCWSSSERTKHERKHKRSRSVSASFSGRKPHLFWHGIFYTPGRWTDEHRTRKWWFWKMLFRISRGVIILRFHVNLPGCIYFCWQVMPNSMMMVQKFLVQGSQCPSNWDASCA